MLRSLVGSEMCIRDRADALLKYETIDEPQIDDIMAGAEPREPKGWSDDDPKPKSNKKTSIKGAAEEL